VAIRGPGTIDGNGAHFRDKTKRRPKCLMIVDCRDVTVEGVRLEAAGSWMQHYRNCDRLAIRGIHVFNHVSYNNDGLDIDGCQNVVVADCTIDSDDDAVCLKSLSQRPCRNIVVSNCTISSHCNAIKMGTESGGGFLNVAVRDCRVFAPRHSQVIYGKQRGLAGVALEIVDGGRMDAVSISHLQIEGVTTAIFLRLGDRGRTFGAGTARPPVGTLQNISLTNIVATNVSPTGCSITGLPGHPVRNVSLADIRLTFEGGGVAAHPVEKVPERPEAYPEATMFGTLPAYGFYCRHVQDVTLRNVVLRTNQPDLRHALVFDDAQSVRLEGLEAQYSSGAAAPVRLRNSKAVQLERTTAAGAPQLLQE
jgi:polygalacturonase